MAEATCVRCGAQQEIPQSGIGKKDLTPEEWSNVQVTGSPIVNVFLCPEDTRLLKSFLRVQ